MGLDVSPPGAAFLIRSYADGVIRIGEQRHDTAISLDATGRIATLRPQRPVDLQEDDLDAVFAAQPELVIVGWGGGQTFLPAAQRQWFLTRRIGLEVMALGPACRTFNLLAQDGRRVVALLFPSQGDKP
jgi:uncharacterized protein